MDRVTRIEHALAILKNPQEIDAQVAQAQAARDIESAQMMSGAEADQNRYEADERTKMTPVVVLTSSREDRDIVESFGWTIASGFDDLQPV